MRSRARPWYVEYPIIILVTVAAMALLQSQVARLYLIPSQSMEPTLHGCPGCSGDRILVEKLSHRVGGVEPGNVVVFRGEGSWNEGFSSNRSENPVVRAVQTAGSTVGLTPPDENTLVKRVVAVGGQTVGGCAPDGSLLVDGAPLAEPYLAADAAGTTGGPGAHCDFGPVTVPDDRLWVMGDNRNDSKDSRYHLHDHLGTVSTDDVVGTVRAIVLPLSRAGGVG